MRLFGIIVLGVILLFLIFSDCNPVDPQLEPAPSISRLVIYKPLQTFRADERTHCEVTYIDKAGDTLFHCLPGKIRYRGNSSLYFDKKSFSLKLDTAFAMEGFPAHRTWILNAAYIDKTFLRNKISYDLFRSFSDRNIAPQSEFTEISINEDYHGLFIITERIDADRLKLNRADSLAFLFKEPPLYNPPENHAEKFRQLGHYYSTHDRFKDYSAKVKKEMVDRAYFKQRYPPYGGPDRRDIIYSLTELIHNSPDSLFADPQKGIPAVFDLNNLIDWHLLLLVTNNNDGVKKNFYLYKASSDQPFMISPWDYDHGFGRDGDGELNSEGFIKWERTALLKRLVETNAAGYNKKLKARYSELQVNGLISKENLALMIEKEAEKIRPFAFRNEQMWPLSDHKFFQDTDFNKEISWMTDWLDIHIPRVELFLDTIQVIDPMLH